MPISYSQSISTKSPSTTDPKSVKSLNRYHLFNLCNLIDMFQTDRFTHDFPPRLITPFLNTRTPQQQPTRRRTLDIKLKRSGCPLHNHFNLHRRPRDILCRPRIEFLAEINRFETAGSEDRADGWRWSCLACRTDEFDFGLEERCRGVTCFDGHGDAFSFGHGREKLVIAAEVILCTTRDHLDRCLDIWTSENCTIQLSHDLLLAITFSFVQG